METTMSREKEVGTDVAGESEEREGGDDSWNVVALLGTPAAFPCARSGTET